MTFWIVLFAAMIPVGILMAVGAFGTWGFNERLGVVTLVMGVFFLLASVLVAEQNMHDDCAKQGGIILEFTCVDPTAIIVL